MAQERSERRLARETALILRSRQVLLCEEKNETERKSIGSGLRHCSCSIIMSILKGLLLRARRFLIAGCDCAIPAYTQPSSFVAELTESSSLRVPGLGFECSVPHIVVEGCCWKSQEMTCERRIWRLRYYTGSGV
jgi:hypothetical protein